jgi:hypothetical protein
MARRATHRGPLCQVCSHPERGRIETLKSGGATLAKLAAMFGVSKDSIHRHMRQHVSKERLGALMLGPARMESLANEAAAESRTLLERMNVATSILFNRLVANAEAKDDVRIGVIAGRLGEMFDKYSRLTGELRQLSGITVNSTVVNFYSSPEFRRVQQAILELARRRPDVKADLLQVMREIDAGISVQPPTIEAEQVGVSA